VFVTLLLDLCSFCGSLWLAGAHRVRIHIYM
jgi:hypothetical protein